MLELTKFINKGETRICFEHPLNNDKCVLKNFVVQIKDGRKNLYYTDLKSLNNYKSWSFLKLEKIIPSLAKYLMVRRIKRLLIQLKMV